MSGPLHGGAPSRVLGMIEEVEKRGDAAAYVKELLDNKERLMGFGHRVYRAEDPRARVLRRTARELDAPRYEVAEELEKAALAELRERRPDRVLETNVEFWAAIVLDFAEVPPRMFTSMFTCARPPAGPRTSSSRRRPGASSGPRPSTPAPRNGRPPTWTAGTTPGPETTTVTIALPLPTYVEPAPDGAGERDPASAALVFRVGVADTDYLEHGRCTC